MENFLRGKDGKIHEIRVSGPMLSAQTGDHYCTVEVEDLRISTSSYGADATQAVELTLLYIRELLRRFEGELVDAQGNVVTVTDLLATPDSES